MLEPILSVTYGCIVYQEQVIEIFRQLAGYTLGPGGHDPPRHEQEKGTRTLTRSAARSSTATRAGASRAASRTAIRRERGAAAIYDEILRLRKLRLQQGARRGLRGRRVPARRISSATVPKRIYGGAAHQRARQPARRSRNTSASAARWAIALLPPDVNESGCALYRRGRRASASASSAIKNIGRGLDQPA